LAELATLAILASMSEPATVFIVDDAAAIRASLSTLLGTMGHAVRTFESAERYLEAQEPEVPGCLLLDINMPGMSGLELQRSLAGSPHARPIVFMTGVGDIQTSVQAMKVGAVDFLTKPVGAERLRVAVEQAMQRDAEQRRQKAINSLVQKRFGILTPRERQVMAHIIQGRLNKQIAAELGTGEKTVKVHRARVMSKMGVRSVPELVLLGARIEIKA
jgi:FixJ family two-component response regulator